MTVINNYINANLNREWTRIPLLAWNNLILTDFTTDFSTFLNSQWDPAWNVFLNYIDHQGEDSDTVVYGYAYRKHWLWINGIKMNDNYHVGIVIWKDYNCNPANWQTFNANLRRYTTEGSYSTEIQSSILTSLYRIKSQADYADIWGTAFRSINYLTDNNAYFQGDKAFTIVMTQSHSFDTKLFARFCAIGYLAEYTAINNNAPVLNSLNTQDWGVYVILQMR